MNLSTTFSKFKITRNTQKNFNLVRAEDISILSVIKLRPVFFSMLANCCADYNVCFFESFISLWMEKKYFITEEMMGFILMCNTMPYLFSCILVPMIFRKTPSKLLFIYCYVLTFFGYMLMGPSGWLHIPDGNIGVILAGLIIHGIAQAMVLVPTIPESIESI